MLVIEHRHKGYKVGFSLLFLGAVCFVIGFALPYWAVFDISITNFGSVRGHDGLWEKCIEWEDFSHCYSASSNSGGWFRAVQGLQSVSLILLIIACGLALHANCCQNRPPYNRFIEITGFLGSCCGVAGLIVFVVKTEDGLDDLDKIDLPQQLGFNIKNFTYHLGFGLDAAGLGLSFLASVLILCFNHPVSLPDPPTNADGVMVNPYATAEVQGGLVYYVPNGSGQVDSGYMYPDSLPPAYPTLPPGYTVNPPSYGADATSANGVSTEGVQMSFNGTKL